jgi:hypothetical protein
VPFCDDQHRVRLNIETEFTRIPAARLSTLFRRGVRRLRVTQQRERERRPGFLESAPRQVTLLIFAMIVMLIFAWNYI